MSQLWKKQPFSTKIDGGVNMFFLLTANTSYIDHRWCFHLICEQSVANECLFDILRGEKKDYTVEKIDFLGAGVKKYNSGLVCHVWRFSPEVLSCNDV